METFLVVHVLLCISLLLMLAIEILLRPIEAASDNFAVFGIILLSCIPVVNIAVLAAYIFYYIDCWINEDEKSV